MFSPDQLIVATGQSVGLQRDHNEDTILAISAGLADGQGEKTFGVFILADGMGGHMHGEVASSIAARTMADYVIKKLYQPMLGVDPAPPEESLQEIAIAGVTQAQNAVIRRAPGGGTTLTAAIVVGDQLTLAHVGDSRAYLLFSDGRIQLLTHDHSLVRRLQELGQLTVEEASTHPQRNVLYRALGQAEPFKPDVQTLPIPEGGQIMLCSDGLWGVIPDDEMQRIINQAADPATACKELVEAANIGGGPDNISVILIRRLSS
ncbi:MAG TPA: protein phosphatase 2C domain-containing protein [Anaerolineaceae bacterium]|nr:protein phosphatase 2C domain-containing protein [Anaerolineaceae bacterium]